MLTVVPHNTSTVKYFLGKLVKLNNIQCNRKLYLIILILIIHAMENISLELKTAYIGKICILQCILITDVLHNTDRENIFAKLVK